MESKLCETLEQVVQHWLANKAAHIKRDKIQDGGEGNGLLSKQWATYYNGSRFWTDGTAIYSYTTELVRHNSANTTAYTTAAGPDHGPIWSDYYLERRYSPTTAKHIKAIHAVLNLPYPTYKLVTVRSR